MTNALDGERHRTPGVVTADVRQVVLVEGASDQAAVARLAERLGRDLAAERVAVVSMHGVTNIRRALDEYGHNGRRLAVAGLCDAGEERVVRRGLETSGYGTVSDRDDLEALGFFVCDPDLEAEMIASIGSPGVETVFEREGELESFRIFQKQPAQRGRDIDRQIRRFIGTRSGRKIRYGELLADALDLTEIPAPLSGLLACF